jgi:hypothetical protein
MGFLIMNIQLNYDQILTVTLPDGQTIEIDTRSRAMTDIFVNSPHGDCYESLSFMEWEDDHPHPSLSAAERNTNLR